MDQRPSTDNLFFTGKDCVHVSCRDDCFRQNVDKAAGTSPRIDHVLDLHRIPSICIDLIPNEGTSVENKFRDQLTASSAKKILITGGLLECAVTQISLRSLLDGYSVFIVKDLVHSGDPSNERYFLDRLTQRGADVVTVAQIAWEISYLSSARP